MSGNKINGLKNRKKIQKLNFDRQLFSHLLHVTDGRQLWMTCQVIHIRGFITPAHYNVSPVIGAQRRSSLCSNIRQGEWHWSELGDFLRVSIDAVWVQAAGNVAQRHLKITVKIN